MDDHTGLQVRIEPPEQQARRFARLRHVALRKLAELRDRRVESGAMPGDRLLLESRAGAGEGQRILRLSGPFKFSTLSPFQDALRTPSVPSLIIDLAEVPCIDSSGVGALVQAYVSCRRAGGRLVLVGVNERVGSSLRMTGLDRLFNIYASVGEAEAALT